ncbi:MAG TPA: class D beta-lactamase [Holosporales bacterium]|nr:class D beta-lactamase [Holosporales bacterium]HBW25260.1 class D beta-lactamase [Holosporales bacterium]HCC25417.1 class D beta-lactamase [Holosporales bacterium]HCE95167.1 class D beta-lactamase [Holosporales bacterium]
MKKLVIALVFIWFFSLSSLAQSTCFLAKEGNNILKQEGDCYERHSPCSTFKIPLSLMGYNEGILVNETNPEWPYDKKSGAQLKIWQQPHNPTSWMKNGCIWYSRVITQRLGMEKLKDYISKFSYGNQNLSGEKGKNNGLTHAWLSSSLQISPMEQIEFLEKLVKSTLPVSKQAQVHTRNILYIEELARGWKLYGKTGSGYASGDTDYQLGWFVGWIQKVDRKILFVYYLEDEKPETIPAGQRAKGQATEKLSKCIETL